MTERRATHDPAALVREVTPSWDAARVERALDVHLRARKRRAALRVGGAVTGIAALAAAAWLAFGAPSEHVAERDASGDGASSIALGHAGSGPIELADGSRFEPVEGGEVTMHEIAETRVRAELLRGAVEVDIVPRPSREVRIEVGTVTVSVLGTAFRITRRTDEVEVSVRRGRVAVDYVDGEGEHRTLLGAGESGRFPAGVLAPSVDPSEVLSAASPELERAGEGRTLDRRPTRGGEAHEARGDLAPASDPTTTEPPSANLGWRELAERGDFDEAYAALDGAPVSDDLGELLLAADASRLSGHPRDALGFLERAEAHASGDPRAPLAAFSSGRILAQLGRHDEAARAFERVLALEPAGSLSEDAMVRAAEAHARAGHADTARALAQRYLGAHPEGRGAARMRALASE